MKKIVLLVLVAVCLVFATTASANHGQSRDWYVHINGSGKLVCDKGNNGNAFLTFILGGPWSSRDACEAALPGGGDGGNGGGGNGGGGNGGGDGGGDGGSGGNPPPVIGPNTPDNIFLCTPSGALGVWQKDEAEVLVTDGYTEALATAGDVDGGSNVGAYTLTCDASGTLTNTFVDDGGLVYGSDYDSPANNTAVTELGFYEIQS